MRQALPWLSQGDIFERVPLLDVTVAGAGIAIAGVNQFGPAVLVTHDCVLDKTNRRLAVKVNRLYFMPLLAVSATTTDQAVALRRNEVIPTESLYIPDAGSFGEAYCVLSTAYYLPAEIFGLRLTHFDHPEAQEGEAHLEGTRHCLRVGRLDADSLELLHLKWSGFWTRKTPNDGPPPRPPRRSPQRVMVHLARGAGQWMRRRLP